MRIRIGTRGSALALAQSNDVAARLRALEHEAELVVISTTGDRVTDRAFVDVGSFGVFVRELESALLEGTVDAAVHSYKDLPSRMPRGLAIAAVPERLDAADVLLVRRDAIDAERGGPLVSGRVGTLPPPARVAPRRAPDLELDPLCGNVPTQSAPRRRKA
jgi:hydroxymethylbilane synthase